jgi:branched-chain amino acid transport system substrate-binding protein
MKPHRTRFLSLAAAAATAAMVLAACSSNSSSSGSGSAGNSSKPPILIGTSLSLTGDFSADGLAFKRGYELWASQVNSHGGLLGRKVQMVFLNDSSDPTTVSTN